MIKLFKQYERCGGIAIVNFVKEYDDGSYVPLIECVPSKIPRFCSHENAARAIVSLQRLGLISIPEDASFSDEKIYNCFKQISLYGRLTFEAMDTDYTVGMKKQVAKLTLLGRDFIRVCLD